MVRCRDCGSFATYRCSFRPCGRLCPYPPCLNVYCVQCKRPICDTCFTRVCDETCRRREVFEIYHQVDPINPKDVDNPIVWYAFLRDVNAQDHGCQCAVHALNHYTSELGDSKLFDQLVKQLDVKPEDRHACDGVKCHVIRHVPNSDPFPPLEFVR